MGGELIQLLRLMRLKEPLIATVSSPAFMGLRAFQNVAGVILNPTFWEYLFKMCRAVYPLMRILRLGDRKIPGYDKLLFYVLQADRLMPKFLGDADEYRQQHITEEIIEVFEATMDTASETFEESQYEGFEDDSDDEDDDDEVETTTTETYLEEIVDSDDEEEEDSDVSDDEESWDGNTLRDMVMKSWVRKERRGKLVHAYSLVGFMLSPIPSVRELAMAGGVTTEMQEVSIFVYHLLKINANHTFFGCVFSVGG